MALLKNIAEFLLGTDNSQSVQPRISDEEQKKSQLIETILDLSKQISRINSFTSHSNLKEYQLKNYTLNDLQQLHSNLQYELKNLTLRYQRPNRTQEVCEKARWTGQPGKSGMTHHEIRHSQDRCD